MRAEPPFRKTVQSMLLSVAIALACPAFAEASDTETHSDNATPEQSFWQSWSQFARDSIRIDTSKTPDPWESFNRKMFAFNDWADRWFLKPVAKGYRWVTPDPVETGVGNVFSNLFEVTTIANDLLQFKFAQAASDTGRFVVNTTIGVAGIFDVASSVGLAKHNEDFGQTLGVWGVGSGPYLVVPLLGSYTLRSGAGGVIETQTTDFLHYVDHARTRNQIWAGRQIHRRAMLLKAEDLITGDRYSFIRDAYLQQREFLTNDGVVEDSFGEEDYEEQWDEELE